MPLGRLWPIIRRRRGGRGRRSRWSSGSLAAAGWSSDRLVLIGVGVSAGGDAIITVLIVLTDPWNISKALTWLSGSTYGRTLPQVAPVARSRCCLPPLWSCARRALDLLALDDDTPRMLGVRLDRTRLVLLAWRAC